MDSAFKNQPVIIKLLRIASEYFKRIRSMKYEKCVLKNVQAEQKLEELKTENLEEEPQSMSSVQLNDEASASSLNVKYEKGFGWWKTSTKLEKRLIVAVVILSIIPITFLVVHFSTSLFRPETRILHVSPRPKDEICLTASCVKTAADILSSLDLTVDPCEDFYRFSCGGWVTGNPIPDGKSIWGTFAKLERQNQLIIKGILENPATEYKSQAERKAKIYYDSCLDNDEVIEKLGPQPMLDLLQKIGGWNISGHFSLSNWSLQRTIDTLHNDYNMGGLFSWAVGEDEKNSSRYIIQIDQGGLTLPTKENYLNKTANRDVLGAYLDFMTRVGVLLGGEPRSTRDQMKDVIEFETELAEIWQGEEELRDDMKVYHLMTIAEVQARAPFISWSQYFNSAMSKVNRDILPSELVIVRSPKYLSRVSYLVKDYLKTDYGKVVLNNYMVWQTVRTFSSCLPRAFRDAHRGLRRALLGSDGGEEPWLSCVTDTNNVIGFAVGAMFVRQVFQRDSKTVAQQMINDVRDAFLDNLSNLKWMDRRTKLLAMAKANAITDMIGFPEYILNPDQLDEKYEDLEIKENEYFMNNIRVNQFNFIKNIENLGKRVNKSRWDMTPSTVNAYYALTKNQIVFPAGILRPPFYDVNHSTSLNYGSLGVVMGHELTHAFDDLGREYDKFGNLYKWWKNETIKKFNEKTNCVIRQYSNYKVNGRRLNGRQTLGENIADNGGLKASYHAYSKKSSWLAELPLPGLNFTHKQLFFIGFAQVWCSSSTDEALLLQMEKDPHSPSRFRVIGPLSNLKEFSQVFNCPPGSKMNPIEKCEIW